jgi:hypothetical protein
MISNNLRTKIALAAAVAGITTSALAGVTGGTGKRFLVQTTGATALATFTSGLNTTNNAVNRGTVLLGTQTLTIGSSVYTISNLGQAFADFAGNSAIEPPAGADQIVYSYHETGSINGVLDLVIRNGLLSGVSAPVQASNPIFVDAQRQTTFPNTNFGPTHDLVLNNAPIPGIGGFYDTSSSLKPLPQIAYSDVRSIQVFSVKGASLNTDIVDPAFNRAPREVGYGRGRPSTTSGKNAAFQRLGDVGTLAGGLNPATTHLRDQSLAVVPFTISASVGTGLASLKEADVQMLTVVGRLPNGADFGYTTRDIGSGTRNQGANNYNVDASWSGGERDRVFLGRVTSGAYDASSFNTTSEGGEAVTVAPGDEQQPTRSVLGTGSVNINEHRPSAIATFSDKTSGGSAVRPRVQTSRMALGVLSAGDVGNNRAFLSTESNPFRVLAINFDDKFGSSEAGSGFGAVLPNALNVTTGAYQMWSASQAVTVAGSEATGPGTTGGTLGLVANDTDTPTGRPILNDVDDDGSNTGIVRKFLDNITNSIDQGVTATAATPFESIIASGFIPTQMMKATKEFDGAKQELRTLGNVVPPGGTLSEQGLYDAVVLNSSSTLNSTLRFAADPGEHFGSSSSQRYRIFDIANDTNTTPRGTLEVGLNSRNFLVGDLNGDGVRNLGDTAAWANALANPAAFLDADGTGIDDGSLVVTNNNGLTFTEGTATRNAGTLNLTEVTTPTAGGKRLATLIPLTDLDGDGNVIVVTAGGADAILDKSDTSTYASFVTGLGGGNDRVAAVTKADAEFFLFGAAIDTVTGVDADETTPGIQPVTTAKQQREIGVRAGQLRKNTAVATFNATIDAATTSLNKADLKFEIRDVNRSGTKAFAGATAPEFTFLADAFAVDSVAGKNYTNISDVLSTPIDLVRANLTDANTTIGQEDMDVMNQGLTTTAVVNPTGRLDHTWTGNTIKTGSLNIVAAPAIANVTVGTGASLTISAGTFTAGGTADIFTGGGNSLAIVNNGTLAITGGSKNIASLGGFGVLSIANGADLTVLSNNGTVTASSVTFGTTGELALGNNDFIIDYTGTSIIAVLIGALNADQVSVNGDFGGLPTYLAVAEASDLGLALFNGIAVDDTTVVAKYTFVGDANLDGQVDALDYERIDLAIGNSGVFGTAQGDLNYDGVVDALDYEQVDLNIGNGVGTPLAGVFIPEPASLSLVALAGGLLARRRRA